MARCIALQGYAKRNPEREVPEARKLKALEANNAKQKTLSAKQKMGVSTLKDMPGKTGGPVRDAGLRSVASMAQAKRLVACSWAATQADLA